MEKPKGGERAILVHLQLRDSTETADLAESKSLAHSAGAEIVTVLVCPCQRPDPKFFIGSGKVQTLKELVAAENIEVVLFDHTLSPAQERNLEKEIKCRVVDRTGLILDIFAQRARTFEGKLQVEVARLNYQTTRLIRGWTHLERQKGGIGLRGGPGETQLEVDRRLIRKRIKNIEAKLEKVRVQREQSRRARKRAELPTIALVGYTNAGKSTLFNALTGSEVYVANKLFATLDPTLRSKQLADFGKVIFADTVGFVTKLPHDLVEAFKATLEEVSEADLLIHVMDIHDEARQTRADAVEKVLEEIGALAVPRIEVYNKIDLVQTLEPHFERNQIGEISRVFLSAVTAQGLSFLEQAIIEHLGRTRISVAVDLTVEEAEIRANLYRVGTVLNENIDEFGNFSLQVVVPFLKWEQLTKDYPFLNERSKIEKI